LNSKLAEIKSSVKGNVHPFPAQRIETGGVSWVPTPRGGFEIKQPRESMALKLLEVLKGMKSEGGLKIVSARAETEFLPCIK
jgi:hypothetical protein